MLKVIKAILVEMVHLDLRECKDLWDYRVLLEEMGVMEQMVVMVKMAEMERQDQLDHLVLKEIKDLQEFPVVQLTKELRGHKAFKVLKDHKVL